MIETESRDRSFSFIKENADESLANAINTCMPAALENPQLNVNLICLFFLKLYIKLTKIIINSLKKMFQKKMWDSIMIILDNCNENDNYDFEKLDPPLKNL